MQTHEILFNQRLTNGSGTEEPRPNISNSIDNSNKIEKMMASSNKEGSLDEDCKIKFLDWGFKIGRLFEVAYRFYKRNENKAFHLGFDERNRMIALVMQARFGNYDSDKAPDIGVLDLVGKRRQHEWSLLKGMTKTEAMTKFICELDDICPIFKAYAEAVKISSGLDIQTDRDSELGSRVNKLVGQSGDPTLLESSAQLPGIYSSLCKQTHSQFKSYAEKQHPGDPTKQKHLIASLQEQYYQQYISQIDPKLRDGSSSNSQSISPNSNINSSIPSQATSNLLTNNGASSTTINSSLESNLENEEVKEDSRAKKTTNGTNGVEWSRSTQDGTEVKTGNNQSRQEVVELRPACISDINCEDGNLQADISCEELNFNMSEILDNSNNPKDEFSRTTPVKRFDTTTPTPHCEHNETSQLNLVETVKLGQHFDLPPIGSFESFPEPKLVQEYNQIKAEIDAIDPNLPAKAFRQVQDEFTENKTVVPGDTIVSSLYQLNSKKESNQTPVTNPYDQCPPFKSTDCCNTKQDLAQVFLPVPTAYREYSDEDEIQQAEFDPTNISDTTEYVSQSLINNLPEPSNHQMLPRQPDLWGPASSSDGCSPVNLQSTFNYEPLEPPTIWTKRAVFEFKDSLGGDKQGGVYEIKEGALIVIQVPTYPDGKYIYWEFATDNYDIGFGVDFVHDEHLVEPLALNIYQENDDDDLEDLMDVDSWQGTTNLTADPEYCQSGIVSDRDRLISEKRRRLTNTVSILPTYRRDSHEEVFVGRHKYPGRGYYLLKFDNTYSVLRSKTLYFRICYFI